MSIDINKKIAELKAEKLSLEEKKKMEKRLEQLQSYYEEDRIVTSAEILEKIKDEGRKPSFDMGVPHLDNITGGVRKEQLVILAAPPKSGKTTFAMQLVGNMKDHEPLFFALEQSPEELIDQMLENGYTEEEIPHFVTPNKNKKATLDWIEERTFESIAKYGTSAVFIDHYHYLSVEGTYQNISLDTEEAVMKLKDLARKLQVILFLVVHLKRVEPGEAPNFSHLYGSTGFHKVCDLLFMMHRKAKREKRGEPYKYTDETVLAVQANRRNGRTGNIEMKFDGKRLLPITSDYEQEQAYDSF